MLNVMFKSCPARRKVVEQTKSCRARQKVIKQKRDEKLSSKSETKICRAKARRKVVKQKKQDEKTRN